MTEPFVSISQQYLAAAVSSVPPAPGAVVEKPEFAPDSTGVNPAAEEPTEWQSEDTSLLPSFGVERARELLMWLINLEMRLPPYTEVSPA